MNLWLFAAFVLLVLLLGVLFGLAAAHVGARRLREADDSVRVIEPMRELQRRRDAAERATESTLRTLRHERDDR